MYCIVPLAGPDFILKDGRLKPLYEVDGEPLILKTINSRFWRKSGELKNENIIFVLRDTSKTEEFKGFLESQFSGCKTSIISDLTGGALLTILAGCALMQDFTAPICVDLVDILYDCDFSPFDMIKDDPDLIGVIPFFRSDNPKFSYMTVIDGFVSQTIEKRVISDKASAGSYFFKDLPTLLEAIEGSLARSQELSFNNSLFLCPSYNPLIAKGKKVKPFEVYNVHSLSDKFHDL